MNKPSGLRSIKKQQTREAIVSSAYKLFEKRGYSRTSIDDITHDANYAPRTFFLHFTSKEDLLFPDTEDLKESLEVSLSSRPPGQSSLQALKIWVLGVASYKETQNLADVKLRQRIIDSEPLLKGREKMYLSSIEATLAAAIATDLQLSANDIEPKIVAAAAVAVFAEINLHINQDLTRKDVHDIVNIGIEFLEGGVRAI